MYEGDWTKWIDYDPSDPDNMLLRNELRDRTAGLRRAAGATVGRGMLPSDMAQQAPGFARQMVDQFRSPMGLASLALTAATTDWDDPRSIGRGVGQLAGGSAGKLLGTKAGAALGTALGGGGGGAASGALAGSIVPGIGTVLGAAGGALLGEELGGLFGDGGEEEAEKEAKKQQRMAQLMHNLRMASAYLAGRNMGMAQHMRAGV